MGKNFELCIKRVQRFHFPMRKGIYLREYMDHPLLIKSLEDLGQKLIIDCFTPNHNMCYQQVGASTLFITRLCSRHSCPEMSPCPSPPKKNSTNFNTFCIFLHHYYSHVSFIFYFKTYFQSLR